MGAKTKHEILPETEIKRRWWWRRLCFSTFDEVCFSTKKLTEYTSHQRELSRLFREWKNGEEIAAQRYELVVRISPELKLPPFFKLPLAVTCCLLPLLSKKRQPVAMISSPKIRSHEWSDPMPSFQWKLSASNNALKNYFLDWIQSQRDKQTFKAVEEEFSNGIGSGKFVKPLPKRIGEGTRNRPMSWHWPEVIDLHNQGGVLNDGERSTKSDALKEAKVWKPLVLQAFETSKRFFPDESFDKPARPSHHWLQEDWDNWKKTQGSEPRG